QLIVLLEEWVPNPRILSRDEALGEFLFRYLDGHGPATLKDFVWWSKVTVAEAKVGLAVVRDRLSEVQVDETTYYLPSAVDTAVLGDGPRQRSPVLTLPGFDEYLLGYGDRSLVIDADNFLRVVPGKNGIFFPIVVASGRVIGTWRAASARSTSTAEAQFFQPPTGSVEEGFARGIRDFAAFVGTPVTVPVPTPSVPGLNLN
ncbi:MAG TPA: crosslink repair DNA glycosylase YcaQ family protein, partial [Glaciibacter sp.]|nr:crosslink repair DNA glycosylase YcaQ family protein [Glaciibacter sp.]